MGKIVALVGMCGSGKSVACNYLESINFQKVYFGGVTMLKLEEAGLEVTPENEKMMREKLRSELGMGAYALVLLPTIEKLAKEGDVVLDGLYSWSELKILTEKFPEMVTIALITDKKLRYERLSKRVVRPFNNEEAIKRDISEIENIEKAGPIAYADYFINNDGTEEDLVNRLKNIINKI